MFSPDIFKLADFMPQPHDPEPVAKHLLRSVPLVLKGFGSHFDEGREERKWVLPFRIHHHAHERREVFPKALEELFAISLVITHLPGVDPESYMPGLIAKDSSEAIFELREGAFVIEDRL